MTHSPRLLAFLTAFVAFSAAPRANALTADLGSDGSYGPMTITSDTVLPLPADGIYRVTTLTVAAGATLRFSSSEALHPGVVILATGDVAIEGTIDVSGGASAPGIGGAGGPGGSPGAPGSTGAYRTAPIDQLTFVNNIASGSGLPGLRAPGGGGGGSCYTKDSVTCTTPGAGGGGGGGSLTIFSNTRISGTGTLDASGGVASSAVPTGCPSNTQTLTAQSGKDGRIRLAAPTVSLLGATVIGGRLLQSSVFGGEPPSMVAGRDGLPVATFGGQLTRFPSVLPVATITAINGTPVAPSSVYTLSASFVEPLDVSVHVDGCAGVPLTAVVHHSKDTGGMFYGVAPVLILATGSDDAVVPTSPGFVNDFNSRSALLFAGAYCGAASDP
jgi:hypothetical protein